MKPISTLVLLLFAVIPLTGFAAQGDKAHQGVFIKNPGTELWRDVRQRNFAMEGSSQVKSVDSNILINPNGDEWARFRAGTLVKFASITLIVVVGLLLLHYAIGGKLKIAGGGSGRMLPRFSDFDRIVHWMLAIIFLFLAGTGLMLLFGRSVLIPLLGHELFSLLASASKESHNLIGPIFLVSLVLMLMRFTARNVYASGDLGWLLKGGGLFSKSHVSGGFFNFGEKAWYWIVILAGLVISVSGLILVMPNFGQGREIMEMSHKLHALGAIILIAVSLGHIYLATAGTEGTLEGMKTGYVDLKWAQTHHDRWAQECLDNNLTISSEEFARLQGRPVDKSSTIAKETG
ncbi:MAG: formate dehydrogenase subunit gamma [Gammaproteobacteria bacterium]|nr:formate dehydrogenase subunit gamma [Gammaproteobacteria bacterium]